MITRRTTLTSQNVEPRSAVQSELAMESKRETEEEIPWTSPFGASVTRERTVSHKRNGGHSTAGRPRDSKGRSTVGPGTPGRTTGLLFRDKGTEVAQARGQLAGTAGTARCE